MRFLLQPPPEPEGEQLRFARTVGKRLVIGSARRLASGDWAPSAHMTLLDAGAEHFEDVDVPMPSSTLTFKSEFEAADYAVKTAVNLASAFSVDGRPSSGSRS